MHGPFLLSDFLRDLSNFRRVYMAAEIGVPTVRGVQSGLMDYGAGVIAGLVYNTVSTFTGSGLIGGGCVSSSSFKRC